LGISLVVATLGLITFLVTSSKTFLYFSLPNLGLASFFSYKLITMSKNSQARKGGRLN
jgi:hypothetical protein